MIENQKVVTLTYDLYIEGEKEGTEVLFEHAGEDKPLTYCHGENMMLPKFEQSLLGKEVGDSFDFCIHHADAYGEYDEQGVMSLDRSMFEVDGKFDDKRVYVGNIIPMLTVDGQKIFAQVIEINDDKVTIDLNHPLAGEDLHFVGKIMEIRDASEAELKAIRDKKNHHCGGCHGNCGEGCGEGGCKEGNCGNNCGEGNCNDGGCGNCGNCNA